MAGNLLIIHRFWTKFKPDPKDPGKMKGVDWVAFGPTGGGLNAPVTNAPIAQIAKVVPMTDTGNPAVIMANMIWDYIRPRYEKWKAGEAMPVEGTPLAAWNLLSPEQAAALRAHGFVTIEQIAALTDANMEKFPISRPRELKKQAQMFIDSADAARFSHLLAEKEKMIETQGDQIGELQEQMRNLMAAITAGQTKEPALEPEQRRKPGRPPNPRPAAESAAA